MDYVSNIAKSILSHSDRSAVLGPEVYTAIAEWEKSQIPVAIVLISIDEVCGTRADRLGEEISVDSVQMVVKRNFRTWLAHEGAVMHRSA